MENNLNEIIMKDLERFTKQDITMFNFYVKAVNEEIEGKDIKDKFNELFKDLTKKGAIQLIDLVATGYVNKLYKGDGELKITENEKLMLVQMYFLLEDISKDIENIKIRSYLYSLIHSAR